MAEPESLWQRVGGAKLPLQASDIDDAKLSFEATDPALNAIASLIAAAIRAELGTGTTSAWYKVMAALPNGHRLRNSTDPVGCVWKLEPSSTLVRQVKASWPLLCVWREGAAQTEQRTYMKSQRRQRWGVMWTIGDMESDLGLKLAPVLNLLGAIIERAVIAGRHPNFEDNALQFGTDGGWLSSVTLIESQAGAARFADDEESRFWCASATLESTELVRELDEGADAGGNNITISLAVGDGLELIPELIRGDGDYPGDQ